MRDNSSTVWGWRRIALWVADTSRVLVTRGIVALRTLTTPSVWPKKIP
jgi:hypothetical protein